MVDSAVLVDRLTHLNQFTNELKEMRTVSKQTYLSDTIRQRAAERSLMNAIQACIDLAAHIRATEDLRAKSTSRDDIEALVDAGIITPETGTKLADAVGLRNHLAHRYGDVDHEILYQVLQTDLQWFDRFQQELAAWYRDR